MLAQRLEWEPAIFDQLMKGGAEYPDGAGRKSPFGPGGSFAQEDRHAALGDVEYGEWVLGTALDCFEAVVILDEHRKTW